MYMFLKLNRICVWLPYVVINIIFSAVLCSAAWLLIDAFYSNTWSTSLLWQCRKHVHRGRVQMHECICLVCVGVCLGEKVLRQSIFNYQSNHSCFGAPVEMKGQVGRWCFRKESINASCAFMIASKLFCRERSQFWLKFRSESRIVKIILGLGVCWCWYNWWIRIVYLTA